MELQWCTFATGQSEGLLVFIGDAVLGNLALVTKVSGEADQIEVLLNVVDDFGLEESLCGIVHDFVAELGFGNVFAQLLDTGSLGCRSVLVDNFVAFTFGSLLENDFRLQCCVLTRKIARIRAHRKLICARTGSQFYARGFSRLIIAIRALIKHWETVVVQ